MQPQAAAKLTGFCHNFPVYSACQQFPNGRRGLLLENACKYVCVVCVLTYTVLLIAIISCSCALNCYKQVCSCPEHGSALCLVFP